MALVDNNTCVAPKKNETGIFALKWERTMSTLPWHHVFELLSI